MQGPLSKGLLSQGAKEDLNPLVHHLRRALTFRHEGLGKVVQAVKVDLSTDLSEPSPNLEILVLQLHPNIYGLMKQKKAGAQILHASFYTSKFCGMPDALQSMRNAPKRTSITEQALCLRPPPPKPHPKCPI